jgi:hypothetical protein
VQSMITGLYPQSIFCAIETSGDGKVNVQSRVQMFLFKARLAAQAEYKELLEKYGLTGEQVTAFFARNPRWSSPLHRAPHSAQGTAADRLVEVSQYIGKSPLEARVMDARVMVRRTVEAAKALPGWLARTRKKLVEKSPVLFAQAREEWVEARPVIAQKVRAQAEKTVARFRRREPENQPSA